MPTPRTVPRRGLPGIIRIIRAWLEEATLSGKHTTQTAVHAVLGEGGAAHHGHATTMILMIIDMFGASHIFSFINEAAAFVNIGFG